MHRSIACLLFAATLTALTDRPAWAANPDRGKTLYVSPTGNDAWAGTLAKPLATLDRARDEIRALKNSGGLPTGGVTVVLRGGIYSLATTFQLGPEDSGTAEAPIVYRGAEKEQAVLIGGKLVKDFSPHRGEILKADLSGQGLKGVYFRQLFFDGKRQHLARWPNFDPQNPYGGGWAYADGKPVPMYQEVPGETRRKFQYKLGDERAWSRPDEAEVMVFPRYNWWNNIVRIASIDRPARAITLAGDCSYPVRPGDRYYVRNVLEELDAPGEWYLDQQSWTLYFWPPAPREGKAVYVPTLRTIVELSAGASHVTLRNLTVECCEGTAVVLNDTHDCLVAACTIRNVGDYKGSGVSISGGRHNGVAGCDIYEIGSHAIAISGGDRVTLTPAENCADNNYLHHVGVFYKQGVGVSLGGVGNRASHNLIHDGPRMGIMFGGNNLVIEYNHIRHVNLETADTGAVYTGGRDWISSRGTQVRYNYFHDILGYGQENGKWVSPHYAWGVYLDDNTGGVDVVGNIVARCIRGLVHLHNGRDNRIENNVFVDGTLQQIQYSGWTDASRNWSTHLPTMIKGYESVAGQPAWKDMRHMELHPTKAVLPDRTIMAGNVVKRNIFYYRGSDAKLFQWRNVSLAENTSDHNLVYHFGQPILAAHSDLKQSKGPKRILDADWESWRALGMDQHSVVADPQFVAAEKDDYRLRPESPAFQLGFQPIPVEKIGPYQDPLRATWPIVEAEGAREKPLVSER